MTAVADFLAVSRRLLEVLGPDGLGSENDQHDLAVDGLEPRWVCLPANSPEAEAALGVCAAHGLVVVPAGRGARLGQGKPLERLDVVVSTAQMDRIVDHAAADMTLTVEAGATLAAVNRALRPSGQWLPFDPPLDSETTIGGLVATQASGPVRQAFGTVRESILGLRAVLPDGTAVKSGGRVVKNVAGYDLHRLFAGSFGTLGLVVEATFKLRPLPEARRLLAFRGPSLDHLCEFALEIGGSPLAPELLDWIDDGEHEPVLFVGLAGLAEEVGAAADHVEERRNRFDGIEQAAPIEEASLRARLDSVARPGSSAVVLRAGTRPAALGTWLGTALASCRGAAARLSAHAHAGVGVARLRLDEPDLQRLAGGIGELRGSAVGQGGYLVIESAPTEWKRGLDVWGTPPSGLELMRGIKEAFDPDHRFAPGRFVGGI